MIIPVRASSIKRNLVNSISVVFGIIIFAVYLSIDLSLDSWIDNQFDKSLINKANYMKSLVKVSNGHLDFDDKVISDYEDEDIYYYQLWTQNQSLKRSQSLTEYPDIELLKLSLPLNTNQLLDVTLPNGEEGRAFLSHFLPESEQLSVTHEHPVYLTIYQSTNSLEHMLMLVDTLLIVTFFISIVVMRYIAVRIVDKGLKPLQTINAEIKKIKIDDQNSVTEIPTPYLQVEEIEPIRKELNTFIKANQAFLQNEKRLTGDIAHELKTPIAEIMSLSEVYIHYPDDERIGATYKQDMLKIAQRMKKIVDNLLLLQRTTSATIQIEHEVIDLYQLTTEVIEELAFKFESVSERVHIDIEQSLVVGDSFSLHTILVNLIDNALFYSPDNSVVTVALTEHQGSLVLEVRNQVRNELTAQDISQLLEPMYQVDQSRTSNDRYGLGLSIVNNLCGLNGYKIEVSYQAPEICFRIHSLDKGDDEMRKES
ncbi:sensor histidine kinase [Vibrio rumoiensis]|uniref:sensor histidine kinase n=1 Tax=Vibrio rumoiensis TaxID=76258 RepID=UPI003AA80DDA